MVIDEDQGPVVRRNHYEITELEQFKQLLDFWAETKEMFYPVFVSWRPPEEDEDGGIATYWLETDMFRACVIVAQQHPLAISSVFGSEYTKNHVFIPCDQHEV